MRDQPKRRKRQLKKLIDNDRTQSSKRRRLSRTRKKTNKGPSSSAGETWHTFKNAKKLHLGNYSKELFYKYHDMFEIKRRRHGVNKWLYQVNTGDSEQVVRALLPAMELCDALEKKKIELAASTLAGASVQ